MVFIKSEGKFNENTYLFDGRVMNIPNFLSVYIIENNGLRLMVDTPQEQFVRRFLKKIKEFGIYPIHKIILTHSHFDHISGTGKLKKLIKETEIEVLASENAIENLNYPEKMNDIFNLSVNPVYDVKPLKEGDFINLNGLELEVLNFFGHTMDSIGILDKKNENLFLGDAILDKFDPETFNPPFMPPDFHESELLKSFQKLRKIKDELHSISLAHFGIWKDDDMVKIIDEMEDLYFKTKNSIIKWYKEEHSTEHITLKYHDKYIKNSTIHTKDNMLILQFLVEMLIEGLKTSGIIPLELYT
ncbi:MAG: MBL fold metallo-hydrolase [Promethearchaeota archaeon]